MSPGGVTGYAAINARVRVKYSTLLSQDTVDQLYEATDYAALISILKSTSFGPYLEKISDKDLTPRRAVYQMKGRLADDYMSVMGMAPKHTRALLLQFFRYFEVDNLKAVLRGIVTGASWDRVRYVLFPPSTITSIPAQNMVESGSISAAVELLKGTPYYDTLSFAMKRYSAEQNLFPLEVALDLDFWRILWTDINKLPRGDRVHALHIIGSLVDMNNLMWAIRYRVYHHLSEEEVINYTLPFGYRVSDKNIRAIAAGADISQIVKSVYPSMSDMDIILQEPWDKLSLLEVMLKKQVMQQCNAAFVGNPFHIGIPLGYLVLNDFEIQDLIVLIEAKSNQLPIESFRPYVLRDYSHKG
jgi:V/A-type H+/Na+-transporting ATPase subunit C